ncbi:MAG TPA: hypothetical protein VGS21_11775, partial [Acidimicrobiales bacterium]|nr:hypothetical protein [Acidimicrobiales bacterium]
MNLDRFIRERSASWTELQGLLAKASGQPSKLTPAEMRRAAALYRSVAADVGRARRQFPGDQQLRPLEQLVNEAHGLVYGSHRRGGTFGEFVRTRFWQIVREDRGALWLAIVLTFAPAIAAFIYAQVNPAGAANLVPSTFNTVVQQRSHGADIGLPLGIQPAIAAQIFTNNIQVA